MPKEVFKDFRLVSVEVSVKCIGDVPEEPEKSFLQ